MPTRTITPGARLKAAFCGSVVKTDAEWETLAKECNIPPLTEEVPPTDGELWQQAWASSEDDDEMAATFLRLLRERDGEPKAVTGEMLRDWEAQACKGDVNYRDVVAARINAHRGVRELPQVTGAIARRCLVASGEQNRSDMWDGFAELLNAELAKAAKGGAE